jgi:hypothetical protein
VTTREVWSPQSSLKSTAPIQVRLMKCSHPLEQRGEFTITTGPGRFAKTIDSRAAAAV